MEGLTKTALEVTIEGQNYAVRSDLDSAVVKQLAQYVDQIMKEIKRRSPTLAPTRVAILAALNVAEELFRVRGYCAKAAQKTAELINFMDQKYTSPGSARSVNKMKSAS